VLLIAVCVTALAATGCSDLLDTKKADAVVEIEADDQPAVLQTRQEVLAGAPTWGGTRVGEQTTAASETALEFMLPGENLEMALGALGRLEARVVSTTIDVDVDQIERSTTVTEPGEEPDPTAGQVRLRVEVSETASAGVGAMLWLLMALFSIIGMVATVLWTLNWWRRRAEHLPPRRRIERLDLGQDPPTQETPRVPPLR
jgi:hypothetical protein